MELTKDFFVELTDEQLKMLLFEAQNEEARRYTTKKKTLWANVQKAIEEFISEAGPITIADHEDEVILSPTYNFDYSFLGVINVEVSVE